ncbi:MAG: large conductance mechanosensitive channel protein MscL [Stackebrandtia sp.]
MFKGFRDFLMRGNVVELAVAVVMGAAMTALVASFTDAFVQPLITLVTGGEDVGGKFTVKGVDFAYGLFVNGLITFLLTAAAVYFVVVVPIKKISDRLKRQAEEPTPAEAEEIALLREIRDVLRQRSDA